MMIPEGNTHGDMELRTGSPPLGTSPMGLIQRLRRLATSGGSGAVLPVLARMTFAFLIGGALGWASWGEGRAPALAALLPVVLSLCRTRSQAFLLGMGYTLALLRHTADFIGGWFDGSLLVGGAAVLAYGVISGAVWSLGWSASPKGRRKALALAVAWIVALLPPATVGMPGHPLIAWGSIVPGAGWVGVALALAVPSGLVWAIASLKPKRAVLAMTFSISFVALFMLGVARYTPAASYGPGVIAVTTEWGKQESADDILTRVASMGMLSKKLAKEEKASTIVWPESIIGTYDPILYPVLDIELLKGSRASGQTQIIGMDLAQEGRRYENAAVAFYPDGRTERAVARQPAPLSLWRPWQKSDTFIADWTASNVLQLNNNQQGAFIFCYEEYLPILYLLSELQGQVDVYVAMANTWAASSKEAAEIQTQHSVGMARLFGRPYVKAENRPVSAKK